MKRNRANHNMNDIRKIVITKRKSRKDYKNKKDIEVLKYSLV